MSKERISKLENGSIVTSQTKVLREREKKRTEHSRTMREFQKYNIGVIGIPEGKERDRAEEIFEIRIERIF